MGLVYGEEQREIPTLDNGDKVKQMAMAYILGQMEIDMKGSLKNAWSMVKVSKDLQMVIAIKATTKTENLVAMGSTSGQQAVFSKDSSKMVWDLVRVFGRKGLVEVTNMREDGKEIKNKAMGCLLGQMEQYTKVIL